MESAATEKSVRECARKWEVLGEKKSFGGNFAELERRRGNF